MAGEQPYQPIRDFPEHTVTGNCRKLREKGLRCNACAMCCQELMAKEKRLREGMIALLGGTILKES